MEEENTEKRRREKKKLTNKMNGGTNRKQCGDGEEEKDGEGKNGETRKGVKGMW